MQAPALAECAEASFLDLKLNALHECTILPFKSCSSNAYADPDKHRSDKSSSGLTEPTLKQCPLKVPLCEWR
eukprot:4347634-Alexandrium_andersonii.AAC.1